MNYVSYVKTGKYNYANSYMFCSSYMFLHVTNASVTDIEIASAYSTVGMVVTHPGPSNHRVLNLVTWKILLQHFLLFYFGSSLSVSASSSISLSAIIYNSQFTFAKTAMIHNSVTYFV